MKMMHKQSSSCEKAAHTLYAALNLERNIIGIRLLFNEQEYKRLEVKEFAKPINYCQMVASASRGNSIKAVQSKIKCISGVRVLGFDYSDTQNANGENWVRLGLYQDSEISREIRKRIGNIPERTYGIQVQPLEQYQEIPDVIIVVTTPYNVMRLTQGYAYHYGEAGQLSMLGNQAICLECTAAPYLTGEMNISTLCIGTRHQAGWNENEMAIGIPGKKFAKVVDGIVETINIMESDTNKKRIEKEMQQKGIECPKMRYNYNYYMDC